MSQIFPISFLLDAFLSLSVFFLGLAILITVVLSGRFTQQLLIMVVSCGILAIVGSFTAFAIPGALLTPLMTQVVLFYLVFVVLSCWLIRSRLVDKDPGGKKFPNVSRIVCQGENYDLQLRLDYASHIYNLDPQPPANKFTFALAKSLQLPDGSHLDDQYEYVMSGRVFKITTPSAQQIAVYASFGGLLMELIGIVSQLRTIEHDQHIYLLIRKIQG
ncbi:putative RNA polymerase [Paratrimastix pyriformis]|uniref:RNA polymerase n=1 Tax=Paratrimastix pyriformis TaxID=342808 RepID=A0ABQ8UP68_9EUKA|nr:putative RNA polymerase [Paratrimastix pyriformis]